VGLELLRDDGFIKFKYVKTPSKVEYQAYANNSLAVVCSAFVDVNI
jgi:hypothetical protein